MKCLKCNETVLPSDFYCGVCQYKLQPKDKEEIYVDKIKKFEAEIADGQYQVKIAKAEAEKAKIMENGATQRYKISQQTQAEINRDIRRHKRIRLISLATVISIVAIVILILFSSFMQENGNIAELEQRINEKQIENNRLKSDIENLLQLGIAITDVQIGNATRDGSIINNYDTRIRSSDTQFLQPKINYLATTSRTITLNVRWIDSDGTIWRGSSSPEGFSQSRSYSIDAGTNIIELTGWGNDTPGHWRSGNYTIEIWHENVLLISRNFTIYPD